MPGRVVVLGLWAGWIAALLFGRIVPVHFEVHQPPDGIFSGCALAGYPKQQDWFRYGLGLLAGPAGALLASLAWRLVGVRSALISSSRSQDRNYRESSSDKPPSAYVPSSVGCGAVATGCAFLNADAGPAVALVLLPIAAILPWRDRRWYDAERMPSNDDQHRIGSSGIDWKWNLPLIALFSLFWIFDSCLLFRSVDGFHEGPRLLFLQSVLAGEVPGIDVRPDYGPLLAHSLWWWTRVFGITFGSYRWWFLALQWAGLTLTLLSVRRLVRSPVAFGAAAVAVCGLSSVASVQYGVPNALRLALPIAAIASADRPLRSGGLLAAAALFSPEYGIAAALAWVAGAVAGRRPVREWLRTAAAAMCTAFVLLCCMFGSRWGAGLANLAGGYGTARLAGHGAVRLTEFPWIGSVGGMLHDLDDWRIQILLWGPGLLATGTLAWVALRNRFADRDVIAWPVFVLLASIPVIARPAGQHVNLVPPAAVLGALWLDRGFARQGVGRRMAFVAAGCVMLLTAQSLRPIARPLAAKVWQCGMPWRTAAAGEPGLERLGGIRMGEADLPVTRRAVEAIRRWCPPAGRVYLAAPRYAHLPFLADRAALGPFPLITVAATAADRARVVAALEARRPEIALMTADGLDVPWAVEHAEERALIRRDYRKMESIGDLEVWIRRR